MNKKFLSLVLALVMVLGTLTPVFAEEAAAPKDKIEKAAKTAPSTKVQWLVDEKIVSGSKIHEDGEDKISLSLDKNLQRDQITRLLVLGKGLENLANLVQGTMRPYVDVDNSNWANGVITVGSYHLKNAQGVPMLAGYPGNKFLPLRNVTYAELAKMLVCLVDNTITPKMVENFSWPSDWMVRAANLGILAGVEVKDSSAFVTRQVAFEMLYNAMYVHDTRHTVDYGAKYGVVSGYADGELKLNQGDKAFSVKLSGNTVYVNNSGYATYMPLEGTYRGLVLGSFVRVIADKDGNATHIVELGNPVNGPAKKVVNSNGNVVEDRWFGIADHVVAGFADFATTKVDGNKYVFVKDGSTLSIYDGTFTNAEMLKKENKTLEEYFKAKTKDVNPVKVTLTKETRYFVADASKNYLTEIDQNKAQELVYKAYYGDELGFFSNVYVGYDANMRGKAVVGTEARIVVFNVVNDENADRETVRVLRTTNSLYEFEAENTKGEPTVWSTRKFGGSMPGWDRSFQTSSNKAGYGRQFELLNVVKLSLAPGTKDVMRANVLIEYATAPSFKVLDFDANKFAGYYTLQLQGKDGRIIKDVKLDAYNSKIFNAEQFKTIKDKWIQVENSQLVKNAKDEYALKDANNVIKGAVSILDHAKNWANLDLAKAQDAKYRIVTIKDIKKAEDGNYRVEIDTQRYNTMNDAHSQDVFLNHGYALVVEPDAKKIIAKLYDNSGNRIKKADDATMEVASVDFEAILVLDANGRITKLDIQNPVKDSETYRKIATPVAPVAPVAPATPELQK